MNPIWAGEILLFMCKKIRDAVLGIAKFDAVLSATS